MVLKLNSNESITITTEIGLLPNKWQVVKLGDIFSLEYGKGLTKQQRETGQYPVYGSNGKVGRHSQYLIKAPGIIVGRKGTIGQGGRAA